MSKLSELINACIGKQGEEFHTERDALYAYVKEFPGTVTDGLIRRTGKLQSTPQITYAKDATEPPKDGEYLVWLEADHDPLVAKYENLDPKFPRWDEGAFLFTDRPSKTARKVHAWFPIPTLEK